MVIGQRLINNWICPPVRIGFYWLQQWLQIIVSLTRRILYHISSVSSIFRVTLCSLDDLSNISSHIFILDRRKEKREKRLCLSLQKVPKSSIQSFLFTPQWLIYLQDRHEKSNFIFLGYSIALIYNGSDYDKGELVGIQPSVSIWALINYLCC